MALAMYIDFHTTAIPGIIKVLLDKLEELPLSNESVKYQAQMALVFITIGHEYCSNSKFDDSHFCDKGVTKVLFIETFFPRAFDILANINDNFLTKKETNELTIEQITDYEEIVLKKVLTTCNEFVSIWVNNKVFDSQVLVNTARRALVEVTNDKRKVNKNSSTKTLDVALPKDEQQEVEEEAQAKTQSLTSPTPTIKIPSETKTSPTLIPQTPINMPVFTTAAPLPPSIPTILTSLNNIKALAPSLDIQKSYIHDIHTIIKKATLAVSNSDDGSTTTPKFDDIFLDLNIKEVVNILVKYNKTVVTQKSSRIQAVDELDKCHCRFDAYTGVSNLREEYNTSIEKLGRARKSKEFLEGGIELEGLEVEGGGAGNEEVSSSESFKSWEEIVRGDKNKDSSDGIEGGGTGSNKKRKVAA